MERPLEVRPTLAQEGNDDLDRFLESAVDMVLWQPEGMCQGTRMPGAQAEDQPAAADLIDRLDGLGGDPRIPMERG